jgi:hypothetical protein
MHIGQIANFARCLTPAAYGQIESRPVRSTMVNTHTDVGTFIAYWLRSILRPLNLCIIGLAFAVALWGFAYKLSLYQPHQNHSSQISVAKMWLGTEGASAAARNRVKPHSYSKTTPELFPFYQDKSTPASHKEFQAVPEAVVITRVRTSSFKPRSPPSQDCISNHCLAV